MATVKQIMEVLADYPDDMEFLCPNGSSGRRTRFDKALIAEVQVVPHRGNFVSARPEQRDSLKALTIDLELPF